MPDQTFLEEVICLLEANRDEAWLRDVQAFNLGMLMDWLYPSLGTEFN